MKNKKPVIFLAFANDKEDDALYLRNLPKELHGIRNALAQAVKAGLCEVVERTAATVDNIFDVFQDPYYKDRIAVFHYGGHASGTQLMLETVEGGHGYSNSEGLVPFFGKQNSLKLVFFNGCSSQQQALELIEEGVPAVVGTATAIRDDVATELAVRFYNGIATGNTIDQAWLQAIDVVKTKKDTKQRKGLKLRRDKSSDFPWDMQIRQGAEIVKDWNLPMAVNNPLFGLPNLPQKHNLPEQPFRFLERYKEEHAEVFFGRAKYIRDLYNRTTDPKAAPVILFYGQSGVGKSSMLDSGVLPRLEQKNTVVYTRRDQTIGLLGTLREALGLAANPNLEEKMPQEENESNNEFLEKIAPIASVMPQLDEELKGEVQHFLDRMRMKHTVHEVINEEDDGDVSVIFKKWKALEEAAGEPLIILLDQVEEVFTKPNSENPDELEEFLKDIQVIFKNPHTQPKGKLILAYRKEYHPEIDEGCKTLQIPREEIFLKQLSKSDIEEVVLGLTSNERLSKRYRLTIEENLPEIIADDLLEDKDSAIAPVLQILLTKMWKMTEQDEERKFTINNYQQLKKEGILMDDFFEQQMEKLAVWNPSLVESGLALDILNFHTTKMGTAGARDLEDIRERYQHRADVLDGLVSKLKELYLLTDAGTGRSGLAHDTIAPLVKDYVRNSDLPGQRAYRVMGNKLPNYERNPDNLLDSNDLHLVEMGAQGMRLWTKQEEEMVEASRIKREKRRRFRMLLRRAAIGTVILITGLMLLSGVMYFKAEAQRQEAIKKKIEADSAKLVAQQQTEVALERKQIALVARDSSEIAKLEALRQQKLAVEERNKADAARLIAIRETEKALKAQDAESKAKEDALNQAEIAKAQTKIAKEQTIVAEENTRIAKFQTKRAEAELAKNLAQVAAGKSSVLLQDDQFEKAAEFAIKAYEDNKKSGGFEYSSAIYKALNQSLETLKGRNRTRRNLFAQNPFLAKDLEVNKVTGDIAFSIYRGRKKGQINIIRNENPSLQQTLKINEEVRAMRFSPDGNLLVAGTLSGKMLAWRNINGIYSPIELFDKGENDFGGIILSITFADPDPGVSNIIYMSFNTSSSFYVYEMSKKGKIIEEIWKNEAQNNYVNFSHTGKYLAVCTNRGIDLYSTFYNSNAKSVAKINGDYPSKFYRSAKVIRAIFTLKEDKLAFSNWAGVVEIHHLAGNGKIVGAEHKSPVTAIKFNKTGNQLVSCSNDGNGKLWNISTWNPPQGEDRIVLEGTDNWIHDIDFSKNDKYVFALSEDKTIRKWHTDINDLYLELKKTLAERKKSE